MLRPRRSTTSTSAAVEKPRGNRKMKPAHGQENSPNKRVKSEEPKAHPGLLVAGRRSDAPLSPAQAGAERADGHMSEYERSVQKNIQERLALLKSLDIDVIKEEIKVTATPKRKPQKRIFKEKPPSGPPRRSLRISGRDPAGIPLPLPPELADEPEEERKLGTRDVRETVSSEDSEEALHFIEDVREWLAKQTKREDIPISSYTSALSGLSLSEDTWTKVVPQRIYSVAFCPLQEKNVLAVGGKNGHLGLWDVSRGDDGCHVMRPHNLPINGLTFLPEDGRQCFTTSYDGITRRLDMEKLAFDQVYATPDRDVYVGHHAHSGPESLLITQSDGHLIRADLRSGDISKHRLNDNGLRYISVHPHQPHLVSTIERPYGISLWDLRHVKGPRSALDRVMLPRSCHGASISRGSGDLLVASCLDNTLRIYQGVSQGKLTTAKSIRHNNHTGRWLTPFKPVWLPGSDDLFATGSMERPRRIEIFDRMGPIYHMLMDDDLQSVCSIIACHPHRPALAGGNSSGRVYLFQ